MSNLLLGQTTPHPEQYSPEILYPIARNTKRPPFGFDVWTAYEISWLTPTGIPQTAMLQLIIPSNSPHIIESKSLKLYFNSFNMTVIQSEQDFVETVKKDVSKALNTECEIRLYLPKEWKNLAPTEVQGVCIDLENLNNQPLSCDDSYVTETLYSRAFRSRCPVTNQPDWATIVIQYTGKKLNRSHLLSHLVSYRNHPGFHEDCIETIFWALLERCQPESLSISGFFTRRGGIDINPQRATYPTTPDTYRDFRQ